MRADFLVADLEAATAYDTFLSANGPRPTLVDVFETRNLTSVEMTTLWAILEGLEWSAAEFAPLAAHQEIFT